MGVRARFVLSRPVKRRKPALVVQQVRLRIALDGDPEWCDVRFMELFPHTFTQHPWDYFVIPEDWTSSKGLLRVDTWAWVLDTSVRCFRRAHPHFKKRRSARRLPWGHATPWGEQWGSWTLLQPPPRAHRRCVHVSWKKDAPKVHIKVCRVRQGNVCPTT